MARNTQLQLNQLMIIADSSLHTLATGGMVHPYNDKHLSCCSIDLTLGDKILIESLDQRGNGWVEMDITQPYELKPKQFILATTAETIKLPDDLSAQIILRSSAARAGWNHALAGWCDPGFHGQVTLELTNQLQLNFLSIQAGMRLVQLVCFSLNQPVNRSYGEVGHYQHQRGTTPSNLNLASVS